MIDDINPSESAPPSKIMTSKIETGIAAEDWSYRCGVLEHKRAVLTGLVTKYQMLSFFLFVLSVVFGALWINCRISDY